MKILVINCGSSSIKYRLFLMPQAKILARGMLEKIGEETSFLAHQNDGKKIEIEEPVNDHRRGLALIARVLTEKSKVISDISEIKVVGHRVVHGGEEFRAPILIDAKVIRHIEKHSDLAPLHNPPNLAGIRAAVKLFPEAKQVACFDTAFHQTIPARAYLYAIPYEFYRKYKIRRYGFHGTSHQYVAQRAAKMLGSPLKESNLITIHLGNGCSVTAVRAGKSVDTSMGLTPLEGLVMGTRSGDIDPAIIFYLAGKNLSVEEINNILNKKSGLLGVSGMSNDMRKLLLASRRGVRRARLAIELFSYRIKKYIGAYLAALGRLDALVFTGGIGENSPDIRRYVTSGLENLGIRLDKKKNNAAVGRGEAIISSPRSVVKILVIPTDEELFIAREAWRLNEK